MKVCATWLGLTVVMLMGRTALAGTEVVNFGTTGSTMPLEATPLSSTIKSGAQLSLFPRGTIPNLPPGVPITGIEIDKLEPGAIANAGTFRIYLGNTTQTSVSIGTTLAQAKSTMTLVYSSTAQAVSEPAGWWSPGAFNGDAFTYTGDGLLVLTEFDRPSAPTVTGNTRLMFGCIDLMSTTRGIEVRSPDPLTDTLAFAGGDVRSPNLRFTFTTPSAPYLVVTAGDTKIANGATYAQPFAYVGASATSQKIKLRNAGGMPITFGAVTFSDLTGFSETPTVTTPPPVTLAVGASAEMEFSVTPAAVGTIQYRLNIGSDASNQPFNFLINTFANTTAAPEILVSFVDSAGRNDKQSPSQRNQPIGTPIPFQIKVSNVGSAPLNLTSITEKLETNAVGSCTPPSSNTLAPLTDLLINCTHTITAAGFARYATEIQHDDAGWGAFSVFVDSQGTASIGTGTTTEDMATPSETNDDLAAASDLSATGAPQLYVTWKNTDIVYQIPILNGSDAAFPTMMTLGPTMPEEIPSYMPTLELSNKGTAPLTIAAVASLNPTATFTTADPLPVTLQPGEYVGGSIILPRIVRPVDFDFTITSNDPTAPTFTFSSNYPGGDPLKPKSSKCTTVGGPLTLDDALIVGAIALAASCVTARRRRRA